MSNISHQMVASFPVDPTGICGSAPEIGCVIPCRDEEENLQVLLPALTQALNTLTSNWEIVLIDDGSVDATESVFRQWATDKRIRAVQLSRCFGKEAAITAGLESSRAQAVVIMDADGQHPVRIVGELVQQWRTGAEVVIAMGKPRGLESTSTRWAKRLFYALINIAAPAPIKEDSGDFRLLDRAAVNALLSLPERTRFMSGLYSWIGYVPTYVEFEPEPRWHGKSRFSVRQLVGLATDGLAAFSNWPLFAIAAAGFVVSICSLLYATVIAGEYLIQGNAVSGWTTLAVALFLSAGLQLLCIGVLGIYLAKVFDEVKQRPLFIVKRKINDAVGENVLQAQFK